MNSFQFRGKGVDFSTPFLSGLTLTALSKREEESALPTPNSTSWIFRECFSNEFCRTRIAVCGFSLQAVLPSTHIHESVLPANGTFIGRTDVSSLPLERTRHLQHRNKAVLPDSAMAFTQNPLSPTHPIKAAAVFFFCLLRLISQLGRLVGIITEAEKEEHLCI